LPCLVIAVTAAALAGRKLDSATQLVSSDAPAQGSDARASLNPNSIRSIQADTEDFKKSLREAEALTGIRPMLAILPARDWSPRKQIFVSGVDLSRYLNSEYILKQSLDPQFNLFSISGELDLAVPSSQFTVGLSGNSNGTYLVNISESKAQISFRSSNGELTQKREAQILLAAKIIKFDLTIKDNKIKLSINGVDLLSFDREQQSKAEHKPSSENLDNLTSGEISIIYNQDKALLNSLKVSGATNGVDFIEEL